MPFIYAVPRLLPDDLVQSIRDSLMRAPEGWVSSPHLGLGGAASGPVSVLNAKSPDHTAGSKAIAEQIRDLTRPEALLLQYFGEPAAMSAVTFLRLSEGAAIRETVLDTFGPEPPAGRTSRPLRADLVLTIFLSDPEEYGGGDLVLNGDLSFSPQFRPPAGGAVLFDASIVQRVNPVTSGIRLTAEIVMESRIADPVTREMNGDLLECLNLLSGAEDSESERSRYLMTKLEKVRGRLLRS